VIEVKRIQPHQDELLKELRLRALQDAPGRFRKRYDTASQQSIEHWQASAQKHTTTRSQAVNFFSSQQ